MKSIINNYSLRHPDDYYRVQIQFHERKDDE